VPTPMQEDHLLDDATDQLPPESIIFGSSEAMQAIRRTLRNVAASSAPVLITGETGTGKEVLARQIHSFSPWRDWPLCKINCPIIRSSPGEDDPLGDSIIALGYLANRKVTESLVPPRTTLFLDEIALLDPALQIRLLERVEEGPLLRIVLPEDMSFELRLVCDTSRQLDQEVRAGSFLRGLYDTIKVVVAELLPLRERRGDIPQLTSYFLHYYNRKFQTRTPPPPARIMRLMSEYHWPGNIRELENLMMRYVVQGSEGAFTGELGNQYSRRLSSETPSGGPSSMKEVTGQAVQELEQKIIRTVLEEHHGNRKLSARALNISYRALLYKIKAAGVPPKRHARAVWPPPSPLDHPPLPKPETREDPLA
jgi:two-component system, NtrC family, response regulator AtoC